MPADDDDQSEAAKALRALDYDHPSSVRDVLRALVSELTELRERVESLEEETARDPYEFAR